MNREAQGNNTRLLDRMQRGEAQAEEVLVRLIYADLRRTARAKLRSFPPGSTLTPTVLVHEAFARVLRAHEVRLVNRRHLFFAFGQAMWRIIVEDRRRKRLPRMIVDAASLGALVSMSDREVQELDSAMRSLQQSCPHEYSVAVYRKILGMSIPETATLLNISPATVKRRWSLAKAVLAAHLTRSSSYEDPHLTSSPKAILESARTSAG